MKAEDLVVHTPILRAFAALVGVGAAIAYYFSFVQENAFVLLVFTEGFYILFCILVIGWTSRNLRGRMHA